jgi:hypothetical protein
MATNDTRIVLLACCVRFWMGRATSAATRAHSGQTDGGREGDSFNWTDIFDHSLLGTDRGAVLKDVLGKVDFRRGCAVLDLGERLGDVFWGVYAHGGRGNSLKTCDTCN